MTPSIQPYNGHGHFIFPTFTFPPSPSFQFISKLHNAFFPADLHVAIPSSPTRVTLQTLPTLIICSAAIAVTGSVVVTLCGVILCLSPWPRQSTATSKPTTHTKSPPPGLFPSHASHGECEELLGGEHCFGDLHTQYSGREDNGAGGGGGEGYYQNRQTDGLEDANKDVFSPFEDPPPLPDPPSQTTTVLIFLSIETFSVLNRTPSCIRCSLRRIKVYTGKSVLKCSPTLSNRLPGHQ